MKNRIGKEKQEKKKKVKRMKKNRMDLLFVELAGFCSDVVQIGHLVC